MWVEKVTQTAEHINTALSKSKMKPEVKVRNTPKERPPTEH